MIWDISDHGGLSIILSSLNQLMSLLNDEEKGANENIERCCEVLSFYRKL